MLRLIRRSRGLLLGRRRDPQVAMLMAPMASLIPAQAEIRRFGVLHAGARQLAVGSMPPTAPGGSAAAPDHLLIRGGVVGAVRDSTASRPPPRQSRVLLLWFGPPDGGVQLQVGLLSAMLMVARMPPICWAAIQPVINWRRRLASPVTLGSWLYDLTGQATGEAPHRRSRLAVNSARCQRFRVAEAISVTAVATMTILVLLLAPLAVARLRRLGVGLPPARSVTAPQPG